MMKDEKTLERLAIVKAYSLGQSGTRETIERAGLDDYGDLLILLAEYDLQLPKPSMTAAHAAHIAQATAILQPRLLNGH
jgi:hypothetical protein